MNTKRLLLTASIMFAGLLLFGCNTTTIRVAVPAKVDLGQFPTIGLVTFSSNANEELEELATRRFLHALQSAQPGTRVIELGTESRVLGTVHRSAWDPGAFRAVKATHGVDGLVIGRLEVKPVKPDVQLSTIMRDFSVRSDVEGTLYARLIETETGATMWSNSSQMIANVAHARFNVRGEGHFRASDPEGTYERMVVNLTQHITGDFRERYVRRRVPKDQVHAITTAQVAQ